MSYRSVRPGRIFGIVVVGGILLVIVFGIVAFALSENSNACPVFALVVILLMIAGGVYMIFW